MEKLLGRRPTYSMLLQFGWYTVWILRNWKISSISRAMRSISPNIINQSINTKWNHKPRRNQVVLAYDILFLHLLQLTVTNLAKQWTVMDIAIEASESLWHTILFPPLMSLFFGAFYGDLPKYYLIHICSGQIKGNTTNIDTILLQFWW